MLKGILTLALSLYFFYSTYAQSAWINGKILDNQNGQPLIGVNVVLKKSADSLQVYSGSTTDLEGEFKIEKVAKGNYILESSYLGYKTEKRTINVIGQNIQLGNILMAEDAKQLDEVTVKARQIAIQVDGDTTMYNASSFKVNVDATAEDLLSKMPGMSTNQGALTVNGEEVQRVLIDGKPFFGDNPQTAVKNLPANVIDKIKVFDDMSDMSKFSEFDDGNTVKTINIITKNGISRSSFGRMHASYGGPDNRYDAGVNYSNFNDTRRVTILGISNNINQQNFNMQDVIDASSITASSRERERSSNRMASGRMGSSLSNLLVDQQNGISTTQAFGLNYGDKWGKNEKVNIAASYFFNHSKTQNTSNNQRFYISPTDSGFVYTQTDQEVVRNYNNRLNMRIEYNIDSFNALFFNPSLSLQYQKTNSILDAENMSADSSFGSIISNERLLKPQNISFSNSVVYRRRLEKKGRTFSISANTSFQNRDNFNGLFSINQFFNEGIPGVDTINQEIDISRNGYSLEGGVTFTEPVKENGQMSFTYTSSYSKNMADRWTNNFNPVLDIYNLLDTSLSNRFLNNYNTNKLSVGYNFKNKSIDFNASLTGRIATLKSNQLFPDSTNINRNFYSALPFFRFNYKISKTKSFRFFYRSRNNAPSITQLQNVVDNSNPLILSSGNETLKQDFSHTLGIGYNSTNAEKATGLFFFAAATQTLNYIANSTKIISKDTIINEVAVTSGTQFIQPVNINCFWNARAYLLYSFHIPKIKSNVSLNGSMTYNRTPTLINQNKNLANNYVFNAGMMLSSNISEEVDFSFSYNTSYNIIKNSLTVQNNNSFYNHTLSARLTYQFWKGFVFTTNTRNVLNAGGSSAFNTSFWLVDASLGYKFLPGKNLELKFSGFDLFNQNRNIQRFVTEVYTEDVQTLALKRYYLATLTYTLKIKKDETNTNVVPSPMPFHHGMHP